jgi:threonyl-tRNA synthetase
MDIDDGQTVEDVAYMIGEGLGDDTVAGTFNDELVAKEHELHEDGDLEIITADSDAYIDVLRHSAAHVFAQALKRLYPDARLTIGPWTDDGFYYDIANVALDEDDLADIEAEAQQIIDDDLPIERITMDRAEAEKAYEDNRFKQEILDEEASEGDEISFYEQGGFRDLCKGPHVASTGVIGGFKLLEIAGAYWRGDEENEMLTRVYGTAFPTEQELEAFIEQRAEAKKRDHRRIGQQMDLFSIPEHSPGAVHFHPAGMTIRRELEEYIRAKNDELGYTEVWTPELNKAELWKKTGHYQAFKEDGEMFAWEQDDNEYALKPMNCANHSHIFASQKRSYRELPIRLSEFGTCYRNEQRGELSGLLRVRGFTQDDGHAYIREDQIRAEVERTLNVVTAMYDELGFDITFVLETRPDNAQGPDQLWEKAEDALRETLEARDVDYEVKAGEGAFYGPKIGVDVEDAIGREWQLGTVQLDFVIPRNFGLRYVGEDNDEHYVVMVHRAILGTFERFMGVMIEHYAGDFPTWLAPEQVRILPISDDNLDYARTVAAALDDFRVEVEDRSWTVGKKIQAAHDDNVPYMVIVGDDEESAGTIAVRDRAEQEKQDVAIDTFRDHLADEIAAKRETPDFIG